MIEVTVFIPTRGNDGRPFARRLLAEFEARLVALAGGFTQEPAVRGAWVSDNRLYRDRRWPYTVSLAIAHLPAWLDLVRWAQEQFQQEAMWVRMSGGAEAVDFRDG